MKAVVFTSEEVRRALGLAGRGAAAEAAGLETGRAAPEGVRGASEAGQAGRRYGGVATDSRQVEPGDLFVALPGERHHGADFLAEAAEAGAAGAVVPEGREEPGLELEWFPVADPLRALAALAACRRRRLGARVVGITGSSGKTTVKEMVACALSARYRVHRTEGNLNSLVGLPLSIFAAPEDAEVWVLELGASEPGEIAALTLTATPNDAVVTTVGPAHLEFFGSVEQVMHEKLTLVAGASPRGCVVVGEAPRELGREARRIRPDTVVAGVGPGADFAPEAWGVEAERVWFQRGGVRFQVEAGGLHILRDALMAAAVARALGVPPEEAASGLASFRPLGLRSALRRLGELAVWADCYNANPESFAAAIEHVAAAFADRRRVAVVGTMLEMGPHAPAAHRQVLEWLAEAGFADVVATGAFAEAARRLDDGPAGTRFHPAEDAEVAWPVLERLLEGDEAVLVKGSRGVRLERVVERLEARFGQEG